MKSWMSTICNEVENLTVIMGYSGLSSRSFSKLEGFKKVATKVSGQEFLCIRAKLITEHFETRTSEKLRSARLS